MKVKYKIRRLSKKNRQLNLRWRREVVAGLYVRTCASFKEQTVNLKKYSTSFTSGVSRFGRSLERKLDDTNSTINFYRTTKQTCLNRRYTYIGMLILTADGRCCWGESKNKINGNNLPQVMQNLLFLSYKTEQVF